MSEVLVVVLTCNRPKTLERFIDVATKNRKNTLDEFLIIIDDSDESFISQNSIILEKVGTQGIKRFHITKSTRKLIDKILYMEDKEYQLVFSKPS